MLPMFFRFHRWRVSKNKHNLLGDIVICVEKAIEQSNELNHTLDSEIIFDITWCFTFGEV